MQDNTQAQQVLRAWRLKPKSRLRDRLLDIFGHLLILAILVLFLSVVQTVVAASGDGIAVSHDMRFYSTTQETGHALPER